MSEVREHNPTEIVKKGMEIDMNELNIFLGEMNFGDAELQEKMRKAIENERNFLGKGGSAHVFDLGDQCIKIMPNRHEDPRASMFDLGNSVEVEFKTQDQLRHLNVDGVYAPRTIAFFSGKKITAIVMERLNAANAQVVANKKENLPDGFLGKKELKKENLEEILDEFFNTLEAYVGEMHDLGIVHGDLKLRNIMIDRETGKPRVIDFGRSKKISRPPTRRTEYEQRLIENDFSDIDEAYEKMKNGLLKSP